MGSVLGPRYGVVFNTVYNVQFSVFNVISESKLQMGVVAICNFQPLFFAAKMLSFYFMLVVR